MNIVFLTMDFPDEQRSVFTFVKQLVDELADQGHHIQVIAPYSVTHNKGFCKGRESYRYGLGSVTIIRPYYFSFSNIKIGNFSLSNWTMTNAVKRGLRRIEGAPDAVYGHFWNMAYMGYDYARENNLPLFVATGESLIGFRADTEHKKSFCNYVKGVICVSSKNLDESMSLGLTTADKCVVIPNAVNFNLFKKMDKMSCRRKLGYPEKAFVIAYVGWFISRKGSRRVSEAISNINYGEKVFSIFIGKGSEQPTCSNILFMGELPHELIPLYLNSADVFVLPTLYEGCCNAIVEAMACGLPIISSNLSFNKDILDDNNAVLIDPNNIEQIRDAIIKLRDYPEMRAALSKNSLISAEKLSINNRANTIINFMSSLIDGSN